MMSFVSKGCVNKVKVLILMLGILISPLLGNSKTIVRVKKKNLTHSKCTKKSVGKKVINTPSKLYAYKKKKRKVYSRRYRAFCKYSPLKPEYLTQDFKADSTFLKYYSPIMKVNLDSFTNGRLIANAASWLGSPYVFGGNSKFGTDCSGFVSSIYKQVFNITLSHGGASMLSQMEKIIKKGEELKEGDILFFRHGKRISHVAMFLKDHKFIHAATQSRGVVIDDLRDPYFARTFMVAGRVFFNKEGISSNP